MTKKKKEKQFMVFLIQSNFSITYMFAIVQVVCSVSNTYTLNKLSM